MLVKVKVIPQHKEGHNTPTPSRTQSPPHPRETQHNKRI
jgi:hypothetical protein